MARSVPTTHGHRASDTRPLKLPEDEALQLRENKLSSVVPMPMSCATPPMPVRVTRSEGRPMYFQKKCVRPSAYRLRSDPAITWVRCGDAEVEREVKGLEQRATLFRGTTPQAPETSTDPNQAQGSTHPNPEHSCDNRDTGFRNTFWRRPKVTESWTKLNLERSRVLHARLC
ncbi:hypothetical protein BDN67DRAFT_964987 [Paxillus ammoniavirescens]|nr:hypothetical protein BDN67DRAFT_964987 [Paxillus ammoniavirescens]